LFALCVKLQKALAQVGASQVCLLKDSGTHAEFSIRVASPIFEIARVLVRYAEPNAISNGKFFRRSHPAVIRVFEESGAVIKTPETAIRAVSSVVIPLLPLPLTRESR